MQGKVSECTALSESWLFAICEGENADFSVVVSQYWNLLEWEYDKNKFSNVKM